MRSTIGFLLLLVSLLSLLVFAGCISSPVPEQLNSFPIPYLDSPASGSSTTDKTPTLTFHVANNDNDNVSTTVYLDDDSDPLSGWLQNKTFSSSSNPIKYSWTPSTLTVDTTYYWMIETDDDYNYPQQSTVWSFTVQGPVEINKPSQEVSTSGEILDLRVDDRSGISAWIEGVQHPVKDSYVSYSVVVDSGQSEYGLVGYGFIVLALPNDHMLHKQGDHPLSIKYADYWNDTPISITEWEQKDDVAEDILVACIKGGIALASGLLGGPFIALSVGLALEAVPRVAEAIKNESELEPQNQLFLEQNSQYIYYTIPWRMGSEDVSSRTEINFDVAYRLSGSHELGVYIVYQYDKPANWAERIWRWLQEKLWTRKTDRSKAEFLIDTNVLDSDDEVPVLGEATETKEYEVVLQGGKVDRSYLNGRWPIRSAPDPYVVFYQNGHEIMRSKVVKETYEPKWHYGLKLLYRRGDVLEVRLMDKDVAFDDEIASWIVLDPRELVHLVSGENAVRFTVTEGAVKTKKYEVTLLKSKVSRTYTNGKWPVLTKPDPHVILYHNGREIIHTDVAKEKYDVTWNYTVNLEYREGDVLEVRLMDKDVAFDDEIASWIVLDPHELEKLMFDGHVVLFKVVELESQLPHAVAENRMKST